MYPQIFGKYVLERELAIGGMARVTLATLRGAGGFEKRLVVKQIRDELSMDEEFVRRFVEEAKTTVALSHPNIVPVYELGVEQGTYFLAMEYVDGVSVDMLLGTSGASERQLSPEEGAYLGVEVCRALDYAHRRMQVVHRDITPRNVMVDEEGQVKIIDFGIASRASVAGQDVFGTPGHMPPEQLNRQELSPATDLFAVAALLMEVWSGHAPFRRKTPAECLAQMRAPHPRASEARPSLAPLDEIMGQAMSLDPAQRPQAADDLGRALRKFLQDKDLGDVARTLGARVREAKLSSEKKRAVGGGKDSLFKPSRPTVDMRPKTFAAREEVGAWAAPDAEGTRRLPVSEPPPAGAARHRAETIATRPIETPVKRAPIQVIRGRWRIPAILVGAIVVAGGWAGVMALEGRESARADDAGPALAVSVLQAPPGRDLAAGETTAPVVPPLDASRALPPEAGATSAAPNGTLVRAASAELALLGDPGTQVAIDGSAYRPCPAVVFVKSGGHVIRFHFEPTGEERGQSVTAKPGERLTIRADFASATPSIRVER